ncbi:hypothetical protein C2134_02610 [Chromobacterium sinusclupearum]|uniref:DNA 3'-5' helicase II n=1 Tax=Chromobacterium sinusclupearum TaxID=2077146 RepID=A0A2K4MT71_9NEIS|nr:NERD domain-containing protein [Chromobacterium sinusclupearum]POB00309.1 hypothetical protein C2134_02610 [Chromobacterium sinusclupearum]
MAVMWPAQLPVWVRQDPRRKAEREVYERLSAALDNRWSVFYSRPWWGINSRGGEIDGEADFVVVHPEKGILVIEVKGGAILYDPVRDQWTSTDRNGVEHRIKDPVNQAMASKHQLLKKFAQSPLWPRSRVRMRHGAVFPDGDPPSSGPVGPHDRRLVCGATEFKYALDKWIESRLASHVDASRDNESGPGVDGLMAIEATIAAPVRLSVPLHRQVEVEMSMQDELLTGAQLLVISSVDGYSRVVIEGGAGTGKTIVGCELAARAARTGKTILFCCLSPALAAHVSRRLGTIAGLSIMTLSALAERKKIAPDEIWDVVLIDEGQDVDWGQWDLIESSLNPVHGYLRVFFDSNQAVYRSRDDLETRLQARSFPLRLNLRNTRKIALLTEKLYKGPLIQCVGPEGDMPVLLESPPTEALHCGVETVLTMVHEFLMLPTDIVLLVADEERAIKAAELLKLRKMKSTRAVLQEPGAIVVDTVAGFKGLEAAVVVMVVDHAVTSNQELSYVGVSRSRSRLVVVGNVQKSILGKAFDSFSSTEEDAASQGQSMS